MALTAVALALAGCGGDSQDSDDGDGTYRVDVVTAEFPAQQHLADETTLELVVRNESRRTIPNLAVTLEAAGDGTRAAAFSRIDETTGLSSRSRPVWIVDESPGSTAYGDTYATGPVAPGEEGRFRWRVAAIVPGRYRLTYRFSGSLGGGAKVVEGDGEPAGGSFDVDVDRRPAQARVTADGSVERVPATEARRASGDSRG